MKLLYPLFAFIVSVVSIQADTIFVDTDANGNTDGTSWADAYSSLQDALATSVAGDEIWIAEGTYYPSEQTDPLDPRSATFTLISGVEIYGGFDGTESLRDERDVSNHQTILSGDLSQDDGEDFANNDENVYHVMSANSVDSTAILDGISFTAGNANDIVGDVLDPQQNAGGGMYLKNASPVIMSCLFKDNSGSYGGAVVTIESSFPIFTECSFHENLSTRLGGAILNLESSPIYTNCSFFRNSSLGSSGAVFEALSSSSYTNCIFNENRAGIEIASANGGALYIVNSSPFLTNCIFRGNSTVGLATLRADGGAIYNAGSSPVIANCLFQGNYAYGSGGAFFNSGHSPNFNVISLPVLLNCVFQGNLSRREGGAIWDPRPNSSIKTIHTSCTNCIIWNNIAGEGSRESASIAGYNSDNFSHCLIQNIDLSASGNNLDGTDPANNPLFLTEVNPLSAPTLGGDLRLATGSPVLNIGDNSANTSLSDLAGNTRIQDTTIDLGPYEGAVTPSFSALYPSLDPEGDENANGVTNYLEYALGVDGTVPHSEPLTPNIQSDGTLTYNYRNNAADVTAPILESSTSLLPNSWLPILAGIQSDNGNITTMTLSIDTSVESKQFFRQSFNGSQ